MLSQLFNAISIFFNSTWGFGAFIIAAFVLVFSTTKNKKLFVLSLAIAVLLGLGLKVFFGVERPCVNGASLVSCPFLDSYGFPSSHALIATALAMGALGTFLFIPLVFLAVIISLSRLWLGVHTLDQVAGGFALAVMVYLALVELQKKLYGGDDFDLGEMLDEKLFNKKDREWKEKG